MSNRGGVHSPRRTRPRPRTGYARRRHPYYTRCSAIFAPLPSAPAPPVMASPGGASVGPRGVEARGAAHGRERGVVPRLDNVALGAKVVLAVSETAVEIVVLALPFLMVDAELRLPVSQLRGAASSFE